jgi:hypothetical protein
LSVFAWSRMKRILAQFSQRLCLQPSLPDHNERQVERDTMLFGHGF